MNSFRARQQPQKGNTMHALNSISVYFFCTSLVSFYNFLSPLMFSLSLGKLNK